MPTSPYVHIQTFVNLLLETKPNSVLDIGVGNGKMGFVVRDLLDVMLGQRYRQEDWQVRIDGIEVFADYIQNHQRQIYNKIYIGDAFQIIDKMHNYEMVIIGDVLEHFEKERAWQFLDRCIGHTTHHLILNIPLGEEWEQPEIYGNPYEEHRSVWTWPELEPFVIKYRFFDIYPGTYATMLIRKNDYVAFRVNQLRQ